MNEQLATHLRNIDQIVTTALSGFEQRLHAKLGSFTAAPAPSGDYVTPDALESFKRSLDAHVGDWIDELTRRTQATVGGLLSAHIAELERRFPVAAQALYDVGSALVATTPAATSTAPENPAPPEASTAAAPVVAAPSDAELASALDAELASALDAELASALDAELGAAEPPAGA